MERIRVAATFLQVAAAREGMSNMPLHGVFARSVLYTSHGNVYYRENQALSLLRMDS